MKTPKKTLESIAAKHGFTFKAYGSGLAKNYEFTKDDLTITFNRRGNGALWFCVRGVIDRLHMRPYFRDIGKGVGTVSREEFAEIVLMRFDRRAVLEARVNSLKKTIESAREDIEESEWEIETLIAFGARRFRDDEKGGE